MNLNDYVIKNELNKTNVQKWPQYRLHNRKIIFNIIEKPVVTFKSLLLVILHIHIQSCRKSNRIKHTLIENVDY